MAKLTIWAPYYRPFIMGGEPEAPMMTEVTVGKKIALGKGFFAYKLESPHGKPFIAEAKTGACIGTDLERVKQDVADCSNIKIMTKQIREAAVEKERAYNLTNEEFWKRYEEKGK